MIIRVENAQRYNVKTLYWKWMSHGKGILSNRRNAAEFDGELLESALRQIKCIFPEATVTAVNRVKVNPIKSVIAERKRRFLSQQSLRHE